jgi:prepilin peptidase CpaA
MSGLIEWAQTQYKVLPMGLGVILIAVTIAFVTDLLRKKIYNWNTLSVVFFGLIFNIFVHGFFSGLTHFAFGLAAGLFVLGWMYPLGAMGAGDIKLLSAIGAVGGWKLVLTIAIVSVAVGAVMAVLQLVARRAHWDFLFRIQLAFMELGKSKRKKVLNSDLKLPFGVAIAIASYVVIFGKISPVLGVL